MGRAPSTSGSSSELYDLDLDQALDLIKRSGARKVGVQVPEGLKRRVSAIAKEMEEKTGAEVIISGDPCYGACDVDLDLCRATDLVIHIGHSEMLVGDPLHDKVVYVEAKMEADVREAVERAADLVLARRVGVVTTVQHVHRMEDIVEVLEKRGIEAVVRPRGGRTHYPGQVLGCNYEAARYADVEEYLFVGTGRFHPLGVALATKKRVLAADPVTGEVAVIDPTPMLKRRYGAIARAGDAERIAVIVSKKPGQKRMDLARKMAALGEEHGKEMVLVYLDRVVPDVLVNLGVDAAVCTACPRIALDDQANYPVPILTPPEFEALLGVLKGDYLLDEIE
ncbi:diphthamide biosynthesis enzyme Dph2 [Methanotrichaceae archaeon M04Ac]|uniref:2-(3-amino-3-carboxypropyl)histidine synthase n=1 Tax=Candidatus Methanocrinis alkalitolerans TaxID=3033395 RepID=A0ABT5XFF2_9EURY|nr:diphthamide biosynthesis enzyme Dph2 [Candidatus Methanocrinis alkalitolerans]MCR3883707.1 diphthamide biosynthesis enzyme Dph2 [Methanothrix sp.]MDF0593361.1 diphthamide biosynthesis enzyme Dph2 [Candidatus Methanocrinis alkalitolerans]